MIIHADEEPHQYDEEYTVILADWYDREFPDLMKEFLNIYNPTGAEPVPQTVRLLLFRLALQTRNIDITHLVRLGSHQIRQR